MQELPAIVDFNLSENPDNYTILAEHYDPLGPWKHLNNRMSFPCWSAFQTGTPRYSKSIAVLENDNGIFGSSQKKFDAT